MSDAPQVSSEELQDYIDGRLDAAERARIARYLAGRPETAAEAESFRAQIAGLHVLYDEVLDEPLPAGMAEQLRRYRYRLGQRRFALAAAAVMLALVSAGAGWWTNELVRSGRAPTAGLVAEAQQAHRLYAEDDRLASDFSSGGDPALVAFLSLRLGVAVTLPAFEQADLTLVSVRIVPAWAGRAAVLVYRDGGGRSISLFIEPVGDDDLAPHVVASGGVDTLYRILGRVGYALTVPTAALDRRLKAAFGMNPA